MTHVAHRTPSSPYLVTLEGYAAELRVLELVHHRRNRHHRCPAPTSGIQPHGTGNPGSGISVETGQENVKSILMGSSTRAPQLDCLTTSSQCISKQHPCRTRLSSFTRALIPEHLVEPFPQAAQSHGLATTHVSRHPGASLCDMLRVCPTSRCPRHHDTEKLYYCTTGRRAFQQLRCAKDAGAQQARTLYSPKQGTTSTRPRT